MSADGPRTSDQRRADLAAAALTGKPVVRDPDADPTVVAPVTPGKPLITVLVPYCTLIGADDEPCEIAGYGPIPAHLARCRRGLGGPGHRPAVRGDPRLRPHHLPDTGCSGRRRSGAGRHLPGPGCRRAAATCELDHVVAGQEDGTTSEANVVALCTAHHDRKEQPGRQVALHPDRSMQWTTPTGRRHRTAVHDHRAA
ncbi:HNH endonuclease [Pseudonocardia abyssalis]|jgi:hypothetical protein|uniref:HNH endonuclease n=1 Tax=Pseudonocardia abyssalis TaxID=2792008 RepID=A0ABS6UUV4_9PSEU|nr:HNH endonuclease signature motif containing protein [Pseudonocardia abyssalis]MBW0117271.1 HNH endonuclease [Pseudonocardia abyssalis]MBW0136029.1 HNH endonuclease [Pseudonocardia abyssalis]